MDMPVRVLHLEDDAADLELIQAKLEAAEIDCLIKVVQTKDQFSEALRTGGYDVILADYRLPTFDGLSAMRLASVFSPDVPFIFVSGTLGENPAIEALTEGATDYVLKQKLSRLGPAVKRALAEAENRRERKRVEKGLRESEERFRTLTEKSLVGVYVIQDDLFRYVNPAFADLFGYEPDEIIDKLGPADFLVPEDQDRVLDSIRRRISGELESDRLEFGIRRRDGEIRRVEVFGSQALHRGATAVLGTLIDVTERRLAEEKLLEATSRWERTFDAVPDLIAILDKDFKIVQVNKAMADRLGATPEECTGRVCYQAVHGEKAPPPFCPYTLSLSDGREHLAEVREERLGGDFIVSTSPLFDAQGRMIGSVHVARDITERKKVEEELERVSRRNRLLLESAGEGIFGLDAGGRAIFINPKAAAILGYDPDELIGGQVHPLFHYRKADGSPYAEADCPITHAYRNGGSRVAVKEVFWRKEGTPVPVEYTCTPIIEGDRPVGAVVTFKDVTEREELEKRLRQAQRMEAIGILAGGIAHDFNNILTPIIAHTELSLLDIPEKSSLRFSLEEVLKAGGRARDLVRQILAFSRQPEDKQVVLNISPVVKEVLKLLRATLPATIEIQQYLTPEPRSVLGDPTQVHQILMNLCTNAAHAMRKKGGVLKITLTNETLDAAAAAAIPGLAPNSYLRLSVSDTGHGMTSEVMEHIFDPYFTTKEKGEGTGLGLSVVHGIVASMGGAVQVKSEAGRGSTFQIYLPVVERKASPHLEGLAPLPTGTEHILVVDDEKAMVDSLRLILERLGYQVTTRISGVEALELFRKQPFRFNLLITDQTMPVLTGLDMAREILKIQPDFPIVLCTGFSDLINEEGVKAHGICGYIMKPILMEELALTVRRVLDGRRVPHSR